MKKRIYAFDFDGTITTKDSFILFLIFSYGKIHFFKCLFHCLPIIVKYILHLVSTQVAKELLFSQFFSGISIQSFDNRCKEFAFNNKRLLRSLAVDHIKKLISENQTVLIISASIVNYIPYFFDESLISKIIIEGTQVEIDKDGFLTGKFMGNNCKGTEKVRRILKHFPARVDYYLTCYGDSKGDKAMFKVADSYYYKPFRDKKLVKQFFYEKIRFLFVGGIAVLIQYIFYRLFIKIFNPGYSYTLAYFFSFICNFFLSVFITFKIRPSLKKLLGFCFSHVINYGLQIIFLNIFLRININKAFAPIPVYVICVPINYILVKTFLKTKK